MSIVSLFSKRIDLECVDLETPFLFLKFNFIKLLFFSSKLERMFIVLIRLVSS